MKLVEASILIGVPAKTEIMCDVAHLCPSLQRMILVGGAEQGFTTASDMLKDPADYFNENIEVRNTSLLNSWFF